MELVVIAAYLLSGVIQAGIIGARMIHIMSLIHRMIIHQQREAPMPKCELCPKDAVPAEKIDNPMYVMLELCAECWSREFKMEVEDVDKIAG